MSSWDNVPLGEVVNLQRGFDLPTQDRQPGPVPIVSSSGITGLHSQARVPGPGVVTGRYGTIGEVFYIEDDFWPLNTTLWVQDFKGNDPRFVSYLLKTINYQSHNDKSSVPGVNRNHLHQEHVLRPPLPEQRAIAQILGTLDDKIELNQRMNETLEAIARALFQSWFVDFDPVRAKAAGQQPAGMDAETAALFPDSFEESVLREVPRGWTIKPIGELVQVVGGSTPRTAEPTYWENGTHHWATPKDLSALASPVLLDTERKITTIGLGQISSGLLPPGTVLLSSRAPIGYLAIAEVPVAVNQGFIAMVCDGPLPPQYVLYWTKSNMEVIKGRANGTTFMEVSKASFRPIPALVPPEPLLIQFNRAVEPMHRRIVANILESNALAAIRDDLLPRLLAGQLQPAPLDIGSGGQS